MPVMRVYTYIHGQVCEGHAGTFGRAKRYMQVRCSSDDTAVLYSQVPVCVCESRIYVWPLWADGGQAVWRKHR